MSGLAGANDKERLDNLIIKTHKEQAVWFLNAFWEEFAQKEAEKVWSFVHKAVELDEAKRAEGSDLDEFQAHRFLEFFKETLTVQAMRDKLRSTGAIVGQVKRVPLTHLLIFKYNADWHTLVNAPQGSREEIAKAQKMLDEVSEAFAAAEARNQEAAEALRAATAQEAEAKRREADAKEREAEAKRREAEAQRSAEEAKRTESEAKSREADARAREDELQAAKAELESALNELKAQEDAFNGRTAELQRLSEEGSIVQKNKAKNELAQHLSSDPLPLRRAKITQEAAVKKADRAAQAAKEATDQASAARAAAEQARVQAEEAARQASQARASAEEAARQASQARASAEQARQRSEQAKAAAEEAVEEARRKLEEAEAYLEEAKKKMPHGATWWMERELHEKRAYLPKSRGGFNPREQQ